MADPIEELQIRLAHQEIAIEALNDAVSRQDAQLAELRETLARLVERLQAVQPSPLGDADGPEPPPPHY